LVPAAVVEEGAEYLYCLQVRSSGRDTFTGTKDFSQVLRVKFYYSSHLLQGSGVVSVAATVSVAMEINQSNLVIIRMTTRVAERSSRIPAAPHLLSPLVSGELIKGGGLVWGDGEQVDTRVKV
jgi:hypothetical protein